LTVPLSPRAARTRAALLSAGLDLLVERPVDGIAIDELVATAGVAKGSFFNHFIDKQGFADAVGHAVRSEIETWIARANGSETRPLARLAGGMVAAVAFALLNPRQTIVLARTARGMTLEDHPLNRQLRDDMQAVIEAGLAQPPSLAGAVPFWLGCCNTIVANIVERGVGTEQAGPMLADMLILALRGLGVESAEIAAIADPNLLQRRLAQLVGQAGTEAVAQDGATCLFEDDAFPDG